MACTYLNVLAARRQSQTIQPVTKPTASDQPDTPSGVKESNVKTS